MNQKKDKGFTLVELLIVIVILGILATVTVFAVSGITNRGKATACNADKKTLLTAIESYAADNGSYPADLAAIADGGLLADDGISANWTYTLVPAVVGPPAVPESYTLVVAAGEKCDGVDLTA
jgi:prepilin-type N-terminal cleavage/methylation domain-containing protein